MTTEKIAIREFRDNLSLHFSNSEPRVSTTRHGDTVGLGIPVRQNRTDEERTALKQASHHLLREMALRGLSEDDILEDFKKWCKSTRS
jgi:hypothetical protein